MYLRFKIKFGGDMPQKKINRYFKDYPKGHGICRKRDGKAA